MKRLPYVWDYDIDEATFLKMLAGQAAFGSLNQEWAVLRLLEYASYREIVQRLGYSGIVRWWPSVRSRIRSLSRKRGFDFLVQWLPEKHPELIRG